MTQAGHVPATVYHRPPAALTEAGLPPATDYHLPRAAMTEAGRTTPTDYRSPPAAMTEAGHSPVTDYPLLLAAITKGARPPATDGHPPQAAVMEGCRPPATGYHLPYISVGCMKSEDSWESAVEVAYIPSSEYRPAPDYVSSADMNSPYGFPDDTSDRPDLAENDDTAEGSGWEFEDDSNSPQAQKLWAEYQELSRTNDDLKAEAMRVGNEVSYVKGLMRELFRKKGLLPQGH